MRKILGAAFATLLLAISGCSANVADSELSSPSSAPLRVEDNSASAESASSEPLPSTTPPETGLESTSITEISDEDFSEALQEMKSEYDDFDEKTLYLSDNLPVYVESAPGEFSLISMQLNVLDNGELELGFAIRFAAEDWIFWNSMDVRADGETFTLLEEDEFDTLTDVSGGRVFETGLDVVGLSQREILWKIVEDEDSKFRLGGGEGRHERAFTEEERIQIRNFLTLVAGFEQGLRP